MAKDPAGVFASTSLRLRREIAALSHYVPRITTVTFIEVFAFFFLKLYRASLIEIKFYQNELTSLAATGAKFK
ncbi:MAG: hypothetical protein HY897_01580 [Deltaproteobacteria bacterium]|nr:hypothetical protein [Deltaproteobacteria bacterium]